MKSLELLELLYYGSKDNGFLSRKREPKCIGSKNGYDYYTLMTNLNLCWFTGRCDGQYAWFSIAHTVIHFMHYLLEFQNHSSSTHSHYGSVVFPLVQRAVWRVSLCIVQRHS